MENQSNTSEKGIQVISCHWNSNSKEYKNQLSFFWRQHSVRIVIRSYGDPPLKDKSVHYYFFVNDKCYPYIILYNYMGLNHTGTLPVIESEGFRLNILSFPGFMEIREVKSEIAANAPLPDDPLLEQKKTAWIPVYDDDQSGSWYDTPFNAEEIILWIKRVFSYQKQSGKLRFKYECYNYELRFFSPKAGNFRFYNIYEYDNPPWNDEVPGFACDIFDRNGRSQTVCWKRNGIDDFSFTDIFSFLDSLKSYEDWNDYESQEELFAAKGLANKEIHSHLLKELSDLGIGRVHYR